MGRPKSLTGHVILSASVDIDLYEYLRLNDMGLTEFIRSSWCKIKESEEELVLKKIELLKEQDEKVREELAKAESRLKTIRQVKIDDPKELLVNAVITECKRFNHNPDQTQWFDSRYRKNAAELGITVDQLRRLVKQRIHTQQEHLEVSV